MFEDFQMVGWEQVINVQQYYIIHNKIEKSTCLLLKQKIPLIYFRTLSLNEVIFVCRKFGEQQCNNYKLITDLLRVSVYSVNP